MKESETYSNDVYLAQWLEGSISDDDLKARVSAKEYIEYQKLRQGIETYERLEAPIDNTLKAINTKIASKQPHKGIYNKYVVWTIGFAASAILFFGLFNFLKDNDVSIETHLGEHRTIVLLDGSEVILNSKSQLSYNENDWKKQRTLFLDGEAYFKVEKGSTFTVNTNNGSVKVLGTQFNVNSSDDYFQVVCYEGKVSVTNTDGTNVLTPHHNVRKINGHAIEKWQTPIEEPTWIRGESNFKSVPVKYVIAALEAQYDIEFLNNDIDDSIVYTGSFEHENLKVALKTVFTPLGIKYSKKEKNTIKLSLK